MTRAPRPGVPAMSEEARLSPPLGFSLTMASGTLEGRAEFGLRGSRPEGSGTGGWLPAR